MNIPRKRFSILLLLLSTILLGTAFAINYVQKSNITTITWSFNNGHDISLNFASATGTMDIVTVHLTAFSTKDLTSLSIAVWIVDIPSGVTVSMNNTQLSQIPAQIGNFNLVHNQLTQLVGIVTFTPSATIGSYNLSAEIDQQTP